MADAVVIPGRMFGPGAGMLMYASIAAERRGANVHRHWWTTEPPSWTSRQSAHWVHGQAAAAVEKTGGTPLLIGKSLGSLAAGLAADRALPAVWLTPLLNLPQVIAGLERAPAPSLLIGGTADTSWDGTIARRVTPHVLEVVGADHGMCVPGQLTDSITVLAQVVTAIEVFLDTIGWPC
ncbi:MAG TPA: hypothetical protein VMA73_33680 [Streptosporangiaceae bacterium]|nr:hypothetical protein [Streptosporangiaceae bacterium]